MTTHHEIVTGWDAAYQEQGGSVLWNDEPMPILDEIVARAREANLSATVDVGCGDGRNLLRLQQAGLLTCGLDISETALGSADRLLRGHGRAVPLIVGDITALPFGSGTMDLITMLDVGGQVPDVTPAIREAQRVLRPGGLLVVNLFTYDDETYGDGTEIGPGAFVYKDTLFRYYRREEVEELFGLGWASEVQHLSWIDPPHGEFRPREHRHDNYVVYATKA